MTSATTDKEDPAKAQATPPTGATQPRSGYKRQEETIDVAQEPPKVENEGHDAWGFARSKTVPRTPPQQNTRPAALSEAPATPRRNQRRTMTPFDTEEEDPNGCEETSGALGPAGTLGTTRSPMQTLNAAMETLSSMRTSGQNVAIRDAVLSMLKEVIQQIEKPSEHARQVPKQSPTGPQGVEGDIKEIKETLKAMLASKSRTWAQVAGETASTAGESPGRRERQEKLRRERAKTQVVLTTRNANEDFKKRLANMNEAQATAAMKQLMTRAGKDPDSVYSVHKLSDQGLRIRCLTEQTAEELCRLDWKVGLEGSELFRPQYGVVIHGVSKLDVNFKSQKPEEMSKLIEDDNARVKVKRVAPLRKQTRNPNAKTQSIVVFTEDPAVADECIKHGVYIGEERHAAERYTPQCRIKQCFNCQGYGHTASTCTRKRACGKCGEDHETKDCKSHETHCAQCQGPHPAWHHECPVREKEITRLDTMRDELSPLFTS